jgi:hypothetical protein
VAIPARGRVAPGLALAAALLVLNFSLTFGNIWPTPAIRPEWQLSAELAAVILAFAALTRFTARGVSRRALRWLSIAWVALVTGHYADVTTPALYGREVNLFWDVRYVSDVAAMMVRVASWWIVLLVVAGAALALGLLYAGARWSLGVVADAATRPRLRRYLAGASALALVWFAADRLRPAPADPYLDEGSVFATPVTATYARQARLALTALAARAGTLTVAPSPAFSSDLSRLNGADVVLVFVESYGAVTYDRPAIARAAGPARERLVEAAHETGREVVSAFVTSPTFGGGSWLAHLSLLSGVDVRDPDTYALLMSQPDRRTLVSFFNRHGYRTVALMPGLQQAWPEGAFYRFDQLYDERALEYKGWSFGWWNIPDQYSLAKLNATELAASDRAPVFTVFPTINTHAPFSPTPPYQPDWARVLSSHPFDQPDLDRAFAEPPDWLDLSPDYGRAVAYDLTSLAGFIRQRRDRGLVMIVLGDHQPPSMVSGKGATWDVPVHIVAPPGPLLDRLTAGGFSRGVEPPRPSIGPMHDLGSLLLDAFGDPEPSAASPSSSH